MKVAVLSIVLASTLLASRALAVVDTLKGTSDIEDCIVYSWDNCNNEIVDEDCRRYNAGSITNLQVGISGINRERRALLMLPGWDQTMPDSSKLLLYHKGGADALTRKVFIYPVTTPFFEGTEISYNLGDYPDPDSGATWYHAWLDVGDGDSLNWSTAGGDYTTGVGCTLVVDDDSVYLSVDDFNRILNYWDTSGNAYGFILINENAFPSNTAMKTFGTTEDDGAKVPMVILYFADTVTVTRRGRVIKSLASD